MADDFDPTKPYYPPVVKDALERTRIAKEAAEGKITWDPAAGDWKQADTGAPIQTTIDPTLPVDPELKGANIYGGVGPEAGSGVERKLSPTESLVYQAGAKRGAAGEAVVKSWIDEGVPRDVIRERMGMSPGQAGPPPRTTGGGYGGMATSRGPTMPLDVRALNPEEGLYLSGYDELVEGLEIDPKQKEKLLQNYTRWRETDPRGQMLKMHEREQSYGERMGQLAQDQIAIDQQRNIAERELYAQRQQQAAAQELEYKQQKADFDKAYQAKVAEYEATIDDVKKSSIDPRRASIPVLDAIAAALGAAGATLSGQPNFALQIINKRIDDDIAAQHAKIKNLQAGASMQLNRLGMLREKFGDDQQAMRVEKQLQLEQLDARLREIRNTTESATIKNNAERFQALTQNELAKSQDEFKLGVQMQAQGITQAKAQARQAAAYGQAQARRQAEEQQKMLMTGYGKWQFGDADKMQGRYVPGFGFVSSPEVAKEIRADLTKYDQSLYAIDGLIEIASTPGASTNPAMIAKAGSLESQAQLGLAVANGLGAITKEDAGFVTKQASDPTKWTDIGTVAKLKQTRSDLATKRGMVLKQHSFIPGEVSTVMQEVKKGEDRGTYQPSPAYRYALPGAGQQQPGASGDAIPEAEIK